MNEQELYQQYLKEKQEDELYQQYLKEKNKPGFLDKAKEFFSPEGYDIKNTPRDLIQSNVDALPLYGAAIGGAAGLGIASVPLAGAGAAAGESLKNTINSLWHGDDNLRAPTMSDAAKVTNSAAEAFNIGATGEMGGQVLAKGAGKVFDAIGSLKEEGVPFFKRGGKQTIDATQSQAAEAGAGAAAKSGASIEGGAVDVEMSGQPFSYKAPQSLDELRNWNPKNVTGDILGKQRLSEIEQVLPDLETKPLKYHHDVRENPKAMKQLKITFENLSGPDKAKIAQYNQSIVNESGDKIQSTISSLGRGEAKSLADAGEGFISVVKSKYDQTKEALKPLFDQMKNGSARINNNEAQDLIVGIGQNTKIGKLLKQGQDGRLTLGANTPRAGISDSEHSVLSRVIDDLNDGVGFEDIQKMREFLRKSIDPANARAYEEVGKVRSMLLDYLENMAGKNNPGVQKTMKEWAINERAVDSIEKIIGGRIESLDAMFAANPDKVIQKVFSNPNYVKVVEQYVGKEAIDDMAAAYLKNGIVNKKIFDSANGFNPVALRQWLKQNDKFLSNYVDPSVSQRLNALADYGYYGKRFLDEVNPSGTAESLKAMIEPGGFMSRVRTQGIKGAVESEVMSRVMSKAQQAQAVKATNEALGSEINPVVKEHLLNKLKGLGLQDAPRSLNTPAVMEINKSLMPKSPAPLIPKAAEGPDDSAMNPKQDKHNKEYILQKVQGTKYAQPLQSAAAQGDHSFAAAHFVLSQRDSDFRQAMSEDDDLDF